MSKVFTDLKAKHQVLTDLLGKNFVFSDLDKLKQKGFYSHENNGVLIANKEAIDSQVANAVLTFCWRVTDSLKFVLGPSLEKYKAFFQDINEKIDEASLKRIRNEATKIVNNIFGIEVEKP